jgi:hypothetical protein
MMTYSECSANSRALLLDLREPIKDSLGRWKESPETLLHAPSHLFWTEHSERHWGVSVGACIGLDLTSSNCFGRWGINARQSADYVLTSRQLVFSAQKKIMQAISTGPSEYDEMELGEQLREFLMKRDPDCDPRAHLHSLLVLKAGSSGHTLEQPWPMKSNGEPAADLIDPVTVT